MAKKFPRFGLVSLISLSVLSCGRPPGTLADYYPVALQQVIKLTSGSFVRDDYRTMTIEFPQVKDEEGKTQVTRRTTWVHGGAVMVTTDELLVDASSILRKSWASTYTSKGKTLSHNGERDETMILFPDKSGKASWSAPGEGNYKYSTRFGPALVNGKDFKDCLIVEQGAEGSVPPESRAYYARNLGLVLIEIDVPSYGTDGTLVSHSTMKYEREGL